MSPNFIIQQVCVDGPHAYVRASIVSPQDFAVSQGSLLGGVRLKSYLNEPSPGNYIFR